MLTFSAQFASWFDFVKTSEFFFWGGVGVELPQTPPRYATGPVCVCLPATVTLPTNTGR